MSESYPLPYVSNDLSGRVAFVTGASSGLGRRFALTLAAAGAKVAATARRVDKLEELAKEIEANGGECAPIALDVTDDESITQAVAHANESLGLVDILVNNAGIPDAQRAHKMSLELTDAVLDTNLRGPWLLANEVARGLLAAEKPGRIVNIASVGAFNYGGNGAALYSISKMAIHRMTEVLAVEWVEVPHQRELHRPRCVLLGDDGRDAQPHGRHHAALPAQAAPRPGPARLHAALPRLAGVGGRHRHDHQGRRRARLTLTRRALLIVSSVRPGALTRCARAS
jgi:NADP-dependent 3-hydroxy acid dehydrogenase YdfG